MDYSILFVCLMGIGTVFVGLICLIVLTMLMGRLLKGSQKSPSVPVPVGAPAAPEGNREELVAAISAALAEELGTDITGIRILSLKKV